MMQAPIMVLSKCPHHFICVRCPSLPNTTQSDNRFPYTPDANTKRETGRSAQLGNIAAAKVGGWVACRWVGMELDTNEQGGWM